MLFYLYEICIVNRFFWYSITCDEVGNPLTYKGNTLTCTFGRRLAGFVNITYTYNEDGIRLLNLFRYRGYYYDTDTSLYYLQSRYYDPETGRFLNADEYHSVKQSTKRDNVYAYCMNNPVMYSDKDGREAVALGSGVYVASAISSLFVPGIGWVLLEGLLVGLCVIGVIVLAGMVVSIIYEAATSKTKSDTISLPDVKSKHPGRDNVYMVAYVNKTNDRLMKLSPKMNFKEAAIALNCMGTYNNLFVTHNYNSKSTCYAKIKAEENGSEIWGIYTKLQCHARALAEAVGIFPGGPEVHKVGSYGHYHNNTRNFHIWFGEERTR